MVDETFRYFRSDLIPSRDPFLQQENDDDLILKIRSLNLKQRKVFDFV